MALIVDNVITLLQVFDLPTSIAFYRDTLGFQLIAGDGMKQVSVRDRDGFELFFIKTGYPTWPVVTLRANAFRTMRPGARAPRKLARRF